MPDIQPIIDAGAHRQWYPLAALLLALVIGAWKKLGPDVWDRVPQRIQWLPMVAVMVGGAFVDAFQAHETWLNALVSAAWAGFSGLGAIGFVHTKKRVIGAKQPPDDSATTNRVIEEASAAAQEDGQTRIVELVSSCYRLRRPIVMRSGVVLRGRGPIAQLVAAFVMLLPTGGCASLPKPKDASLAVHDVCVTVMAQRAEVMKQAKVQGVSVYDAARGLCALNDVIRPFLAGAQQAGDQAVGAARTVGALRE